jgi:hypothetical protein
VRGRAPDDGVLIGEGLLRHIGEEWGVRGGGDSGSEITVLSKAFS